MLISDPYKRVVIITGSFGSGKSELAINLALQTRPTEQRQLALVDLDLVNAYFRSRELHEFLESQEIKAVIPSKDIRFSDLPIAGPGIGPLISQEACRVIVDVGGDNLGATALGTYRSEIQATDASIVMVVNPCRPFTNSLRAIEEMKLDIEYSSGLHINTLVSNPNIGPGTPVETILAKHQLVLEAADYLQLPVVELLVLKDIFMQHQAKLQNLEIPIRPLDIFLSPAWLVKQLKEDSCKSDRANF